MTLRQILILIISAIVLFFSHDYYKNNFCLECCTPGATTGQGLQDEVSGALSATGGPLVYKWSSEDAIKGEGFDSYKAEILAENGDGKALEITGHYFEDEVNETDSENLGLARAKALVEILSEDEPNLNYEINSKLVDLIPGADSNEFESVSYAWITDKGLEEETIEIADSGEAKILFPFNSSDKIDSPEIEDYLNYLAERLKSNTNETVYIVGHTDSLGEPGANRRLSERRAKKIRDILKKKGVHYKQIITRGRGEADPVAPNSSEASRQLNRRVDITIK